MANRHRSLIQTLLLLAALFIVAPVSAGLPHFFPNISSIPPSLIPNVTAGAWDAFRNFSGCHPGDHVAGLSKLKNYFRYFGYINGDNSMNFTDDFDDVLASAVKTYQLNFNLNVTGVLDAPTINQISMPRCGNADIINGTSSMNYGRAPSPSSSPSPIHLHAVAHYSFFPGSPRWPPSKTNLSYAFLPANQLTDPVKVVFATAFDRWSEVTPLTFVETAAFQSADIRIGFFSGDHGDGEPFDGVLGTLAHAFSPPSGHFHLDGDENWVVNGDFSAATSLLSAVDLESVAVHEIGHVLGLGHSSVEEAIMYPSISSMTRKVELAPDDIAGIQVLYGPNTGFNGSVAPPGFNGSAAPPMTQQRDTSGAHSVGPLMWLRFLLAVGLLSLIL